MWMRTISAHGIIVHFFFFLAEVHVSLLYKIASSYEDFSENGLFILFIHQDFYAIFVPKQQHS